LKNFSADHYLRRLFTIWNGSQFFLRNNLKDKSFHSQ